MIYVPMLKTRMHENIVAKELNYCFSENIIPLIEILKDYYKPRYKINSQTGEYLYERKGKRKYKIHDTPQEKDIITLEKLNNIVNKNLAFIDFFRYSNEKYKQPNIDLKRVSLSYKLNDNVELYNSRLREVSAYKNFIPVVSIKKSFVPSTTELELVLKDLIDQNEIISLRITDEYLSAYKELIVGLLRPNDFLLFDIQEQAPDVKFMEYEELQSLGIVAKIILVNSPRRAKVKNGKYPEDNYTDLIDNSAKSYIAKYKFDGYGDYCGLKDQLPAHGGPFGSAIILTYNYKDNKFWTYTNKDSKLGSKGYKTLIPLVERDREKFNLDNTCEGYKRIDKLSEFGNFATWNNICIRRYIHQVYKNIH